MSTKSQDTNELYYRRSRGEFDGPPGIYGFVRGRKFLLDEELVLALEAEVSKFATCSAKEIGETIEQLLEADGNRAATKMFVAGLMRELRPYTRLKAIEVDDAEIPSTCDCCGRAIPEIGFFFDACTTDNMLWGYLCPPCFFKVGCGVGEGYGQLYRINGESVFMILGHPKSEDK